MVHMDRCRLMIFAKFCDFTCRKQEICSSLSLNSYLLPTWIVKRKKKHVFDSDGWVQPKKLYIGLPYIGQSSLDLVEEYFTRQPQCTTMHQKKTRLSFSQLSTRDTHERGEKNRRTPNNNNNNNNNIFLTTRETPKAVLPTHTPLQKKEKEFGKIMMVTGLRIYILYVPRKRKN